MVHILVVDDEPLIAIMLQDWLNEIGFKTVGPACNIADALRLVGSEIIDAAILDVSVGNSDTVPVARALKEKLVPFIYLTGHVNFRLPTVIEGAPVATKPVDFTALEILLRKLLESKPSL